MEFINLLLNLLAWWLWAGAFVFPRYAVRSSQPLTLLSTLRSESPQGFGRYVLLVALLGLIGLRAVAYWNFAPPGSALPQLDFGIVSVSFRTDSLAQMGCYSVASFAVFLYVYYLCVFGLSLTCRQRTRVDSIENLVNQQLNRAAYWHPGIKLAAGTGGGVLIWIIFGAIMVRLGALPGDWSFGTLLLQSPIMAASLWLFFVIVVLGVIAFHLLHSYVYLGEQALWKFIDECAKFYLSPFRSLPLLVGRFDFSPILGILVYWFGLELGDWVLRIAFARVAA